MDFDDGGEAWVEVDYYAGHAGAWGAFSWDVGALAFRYPGARASLDYDSHRYKIDVGRMVDTFNLKLYYNRYHDYFGSGPAHYLEAGASLPRLQDNALLALADYTYRHIAVYQSRGDWELNLTAHRTGLARAQYFGGLAWCRDAVVMQLSRHIRLCGAAP